MGCELFTSRYPRVMVSSTDFGNSLTVDNTSSAHYTLTVSTVVAAICLPLILPYQGWIYHVFRQRVGGEELTAAPVAAEPTRPDRHDAFAAAGDRSVLLITHRRKELTSSTRLSSWSEVGRASGLRQVERGPGRVFAAHTRLVSAERSHLRPSQVAYNVSRNQGSTVRIRASALSIRRYSCCLWRLFRQHGRTRSGITRCPKASNCS